MEQIWRSTPPVPQPGHRIGNYEIVRPIGQGGFGIVYLANDLQLNREVALKVPRIDVITDDDRRKRFEREALIVADLDHPGIAPVYEAKLQASTPYIASAYYPYQDLGTWLNSREQSVPWRQAVAFVIQVAHAAQHAHDRGVIHRDLKPGNILLSIKNSDPDKQEANGEQQSLEQFDPKLTDFGMAKSLIDDAMDTRSSVLIGTPLYMAPEQFRSYDTVAAKSPAASIDIYALGCLLFELTTGKAPFAGGSYLEVVEAARDTPAPRLREKRPDIPQELNTICGICLEKEPTNRYSSAGDLARDLQNCLDGEPIFGRPPSFLQRFKTWAHQPDRIWHAGLYAVVVHSLLLVWLTIATSLMFFQPGLFANFEMGTNGFFLLFVEAVKLAFTVHVPMVFIGWQVFRGRRWAVWTGVVLSALCLIPPLLLSLGAIDLFAAVYQDSPYHRVMTATMVLLLMLTQFAIFILALIAQRRKFAGR